jgi:Copper type II ascorbate-dependent monooxygenase, C-terminal domain
MYAAGWPARLLLPTLKAGISGLARAGMVLYFAPMSILRRGSIPALSLACVLAPGVFACGGSDSKAAAVKAVVSSAADASTGEWKTLLTGEWTMPPGTEGYVCARHTIDEDLYVNGFDAIKPLGTHHTLLTMGEPNAPDGLTPCNAGENRPLSVFGSGLGTDLLEFPPGVGLKIAKGSQVLLNLHLFNSGADDLSGLSGTRVRTMPESEVKDIAEGILAGTLMLRLPPGETTTSIGHCTMSSDVTLFAVAPHMHQLGIHEKVVAERASADEVVLLDAPYDFNEQSYGLIEPLKLTKGDRVRVECTHRNTTDKIVTFGESTLSEMCFAGLYRYPADGSVFLCMDPPADH